MGTRFVATRESMAPEFWKQAMLQQEMWAAAAKAGNADYFPLGLDFRA